MNAQATPTNRELLYIDGSWQSPADGATTAAVNPATEETIGHVGMAGEADVEKAVAAARAAFDRGDWRETPPEERAAVLDRAADILEARHDEIVELLTTELGCPHWFSDQFHVPVPILLMRDFAKIVASYPPETEFSDGTNRSVLVRQPVGVVGAVTPWNGPLVHPVLKIAPAIAAGCSIVLKAAPLAPLTGFLLVEALEQAGLPPGVVNYMAGDRDAGRALVGHPDVDKVAFTGSTAAGKAIMAACAERIARVTLELGGKSAAIMLDDADAATYVAGVIPMGVTLVNGQACTAMTRLLVPRHRHDEVAEALTEAVRALPVGDPFDPATQVGPLVSHEQRQRVEQLIEAGRREGARISVGGGRPAGLDRGWYVEPTVFSDVSNEMTIAQEEIFGPVVAVIPYDDDDDAVRIANDSIYGLSGSVWTSDPQRGRELARRIRTGMISINDAPQALGSPFGGFKQSGVGREFGLYGLEAYTELQSIAVAP